MTLIGFKCGNDGALGTVNPEEITSVRGSLNGPNFTDVCTSDGKVLTVQGTIQETLLTLGVSSIKAQSVESIPVRRHVLSAQEIMDACEEKREATDKNSNAGARDTISLLVVGAIIGVVLAYIGFVFCTHAFRK